VNIPLDLAQAQLWIDFPSANQGFMLVNNNRDQREVGHLPQFHQACLQLLADRPRRHDCRRAERLGWTETCLDINLELAHELEAGAIRAANDLRSMAERRRWNCLQSDVERIAHLENNPMHMVAGAWLLRHRPRADAL
jgi:hypothetical protein